MTEMWTLIGDEMARKACWKDCWKMVSTQTSFKNIKSRRGGRQFRKDQGSKTKIIFTWKIKVWTKYSKKNFEMKTSDKNAIGMARGVGEQSAPGKTYKNSITQ